MKIENGTIAVGLMLHLQVPSEWPPWIMFHDGIRYGGFKTEEHAKLVAYLNDWKNAEIRQMTDEEVRFEIARGCLKEPA
jgi:hypothetical protein